MDKRKTRGLATFFLLLALCLLTYQQANLSGNKAADTDNETEVAKQSAAKIDKLQQEAEDWQRKYEELKQEQPVQEKKTAKEKPEKEQEKTYKLTIKPGMASKEISDALEKAGIIHNSEDFNDYLEAKELQTKIRTGTFTLEKDMPYQDISALLTKQQ